MRCKKLCPNLPLVCTKKLSHQAGHIADDLVAWDDKGNKVILHEVWE